MSPRKPRLATLSNLGRGSRAQAAARARVDASVRTNPALGAFCTDCDAAIGALRQALRALAQAASSDPLRPQEVARAFGINKNLTWKFARVLLAEDSFDAISMLPGADGVEIYLRAFEAAGFGRAHTDPVRDAIERFDAVVVRHFGDRGQLEVVLDGLRSDGNLESSRRMAFKGMSGVFGLQARVRLTTQILLPPEGDELKASIAQIVGLVGLQRLRPIGALPVFRSSGTQASASGPQPLFTSGAGESGDFLLRDYSSFPSATVRSRQADGRMVIELTEGPIGRIGEADLFFGTLQRGLLGVRRLPDDAHNDFLTNISIPSESLVVDSFCHRSLVGTESMRATVHSTLGQPLSNDEAQREQSMLPIDPAPVTFERLDAVPSIHSMPSYERMVHAAFKALGQDFREYRLVRVQLAYPPTPSGLLLRWTLPE